MFRNAGLSLAAVVLGALALAPASLAAHPPTQTLTPPPQPYETCKAVGGGTICSGTHTVTYSPVDTGLACGSRQAPSRSSTRAPTPCARLRWYDKNGNLTRRQIYYDKPAGDWSDPLTSATLDYNQRYDQTDVLAVPGDLTSSTETITGENIFRMATGASMIINAGRQVYNFDQSELAGRNDFVEAIFEGDPAPLERICAALGA